MATRLNRNRIVGFRASIDFTNRFDNICDQLGLNRSQVMRYAALSLMRSISDDPVHLNQIRLNVY